MNREVPDQPAYLDKDIGLIAKILTRRVPVQTGLGLHPLYMPWGPFGQPAAKIQLNSAIRDLDFKAMIL